MPRHTIISCTLNLLLGLILSQQNLITTRLSDHRNGIDHVIGVNGFNLNWKFKSNKPKSQTNANVISDRALNNPEYITRMLTDVSQFNFDEVDPYGSQYPLGDGWKYLNPALDPQKRYRGSFDVIVVKGGSNSKDTFLHAGPKHNKYLPQFVGGTMRKISFPRAAPGWTPSQSKQIGQYGGAYSDFTRRFDTPASWDDQKVCAANYSIEMLVAHNILRRNPQVYIDLAKKWLLHTNYDYQNGQIHWHCQIASNEGGQVSREGKKPIEETIKWLEWIRDTEYFRDTPDYLLDDRLSKATRDHVKDMQQWPIEGKDWTKDSIAHMGSDGLMHSGRISKYMNWNSHINSELSPFNRVAENIAQTHTGFATAIEIVLMLFIDDGVANRGHRYALMNRSYTRLGSCVARRKWNPRMKGAFRDTEVLAVINYSRDSQCDLTTTRLIDLSQYGIDTEIQPTHQELLLNKSQPKVNGVGGQVLPGIPSDFVKPEVGSDYKRPSFYQISADITLLKTQFDQQQETGSTGSGSDKSDYQDSKDKDINFKTEVVTVTNLSTNNGYLERGIMNKLVIPHSNRLLFQNQSTSDSNNGRNKSGNKENKPPRHSDKYGENQPPQDNGINKNCKNQNPYVKPKNHSNYNGGGPGPGPVLGPGSRTGSKSGGPTTTSSTSSFRVDNSSNNRSSGNSYTGGYTGGGGGTGGNGFRSSSSTPSSNRNGNESSNFLNKDNDQSNSDQKVETNNLSPTKTEDSSDTNTKSALDSSNESDNTLLIVGVTGSAVVIAVVVFIGIAFKMSLFGMSAAATASTVGSVASNGSSISSKFGPDTSKIGDLDSNDNIYQSQKYYNDVDNEVSENCYNADLNVNHNDYQAANADPINYNVQNVETWTADNSAPKNENTCHEHRDLLQDSDRND